jgi:hypothetical protein
MPTCTGSTPSATAAMGVSNEVIIYATKDGNDRKVFAAKEWIAPMCSHVPNRGVQMVKYCGWCSNVLRGKRDHDFQSSRRRKSLSARIEYAIHPSDRASDRNPSFKVLYQTGVQLNIQKAGVATETL